MTTLQAEEILAQASPDSISELFARDPLSWTDADVDRMIAHLREARTKMDTNQAPKKKAALAGPKPDLALGVDDLLSSIGL